MDWHSRNESQDVGEHYSELRYMVLEACRGDYKRLARRCRQRRLWKTRKPGFQVWRCEQDHRKPSTLQVQRQDYCEDDGEHSAR